MKRIVWLALAAVLIAGCDKEEKSVANQPPPAKEPPKIVKEEKSDGWTRYDRRSEGFAVELPDDWVQIDLTSADVETMMRKAAQEQDELKRSLAGQAAAMVAEGVKFIAGDPKSDKINTGVFTNVNVVVEEIDPKVTADQYEKSAKGQVSDMGIQFAFSHKTYPAGKALVMEGRAKAGLIYSYIWVKPGKAYTFTLVTAESEKPRVKPVLDEMLKRFVVY